MSTKQTLILGVGNDILTDDGIGPKLVRDLARIFEDKDVRFDTIFSGGLQIMEFIEGYKRVVFIDAIRTDKGKPGDVYYFLPSDLRETLHLSNLHDVNFPTALKLGNTLNLDIPVDLHIIAVEIFEDKKFGEELSPVLKKKYNAILNNVNGLIRKIISKDKSLISF